MRYRKAYTVLTAILCLAVLAAGCGKKDYRTYRKLSWEGTELTISLGQNKSTGCEWTTRSQDDKVIDYSINRVFHIKTNAGGIVGILDAGFEGKGPGTTQIVCTTPVGWDGTGEGYTYTVTVTVSEDGTIKTATGE